jgi:hypothetical protein
MADKKVEEGMHVENPPPGFQLVHIDPQVEKRVVRKLDLNVMPLVVALCKWCSIHKIDCKETLILTYVLRSGIIFGSIQYWKCPNCWYEQSITRK